MTGRLLSILIVVLLAACQPADTLVLPTVADLDAIATDDMATASALATPTRRPLPPTFTPLPTFSPTATDPADVPTATPEGFRADGTIFYIFNDNSLAELAADGSFEDLLPVPHIGQLITGLSASPDGAWLAYVAPGAGSAREVYVTDRSGTNTRQVSRLGFSEMQRPVWRPDGGALAFVAAQAPGAPMAIYTVAADGSGQRPVIQLPSTGLQDLSWSADGEWLYFSDDAIYAVNATTGEVSQALTQITGYGPDFMPVHSPSQPELYYLKTRQDMNTGIRGGNLSFFDTQHIPEQPVERPGAELYVDELEYSRDGEFLLISGERGIWVQRQAVQTASQIVNDLVVDPEPTFSPDASRVAYVNVDSLGIPQIYVVDRREGDMAQITAHQDGTISDLVWLPG